VPKVSPITLRELVKRYPKNQSIGVESQAIANIDWKLNEDEADLAIGTLTVEFFQRGTYEYYEVPLDVYVDFQLASSLGTFFNLYVRNAGFDYRRIA
jgi:KTSC domain